MSHNRGFFIVFEGTDGTGKSTQLALLASFLKNEGFKTLTTREPTDGQYGRRIRDLYRNRGSSSPEKELELFLSDRREHVENLIRPKLDEGWLVLCDRYFLSTVAYQGALGFDPETLFARHHFAPDPDLALLFEAEIEVGTKRIRESRGETPNDFEKADYLQEVARIFAGMKKDYIVTIDAARAIDEVHREIVEIVMAKLQTR